MKRLFWIVIATSLAITACTDDGGDQSSEDSATTPPTATVTLSPTPTAELAFCENPGGFTIGYPEEWHTNSGDVVPPCSQFHPEPFEVPRGTDERVAAIAAFIDPVPYERAAAPNERRDAEREELTIAGRDALRLEFGAGPDSIWPEGTPITMYAIEVPPSEGGREQTLFLDTVGLEIFDYERNQEVLDRIAPDLEWSA